MRHIGLHLRINNSILDTAHQAIQMETPIFQCFVTQTEQQYSKIDTQILSAFHELRNKLPHVYIHGSYWINLAETKKGSIRTLRQEIDITKQLECTHIILHPGSCSQAQNVQLKVDPLARTLNAITKNESEIIFVLENTVHTKSVGSDLQDFYYLKQKLEFPDRIAFCIDTAHAHAYGYDIVTQQNNFIELIDQTIGISNLALIHLNDATHERGSHIDKHAPLGEGYIGNAALKTFALHPQLASIPLILELPILPKEQETATLHKVRSWHQQHRT